MTTKVKTDALQRNIQSITFQVETLEKPKKRLIFQGLTSEFSEKGEKSIAFLTSGSAKKTRCFWEPLACSDEVIRILVNF